MIDGLLKVILPYWCLFFFAFATVIHFYRAMLCESSVIAVARCPSVRPSRWCIVSKRLKISSNFFLGPVEPWF